MNPDRDGGSAFPVHYAKDPEPFSAPAKGMSLRDYFASQAMIALLQRVEWPQVIIAAEEAYKLADSMLAERAK